MADDVNSKLAALKERRLARMQKAEEESSLRELQELELEEKLSAEIGKRGVDFEIISTVDGPVAVKLGPAVLFKQLRDSTKDNVKTDDLHRFVAPCVVHPDLPTFNAMIEKRHGILVRCSDALVVLYRGQEEDSRGKF